MFILLILDIGDFESENELFPYKAFPKGSRIVVYGAGIFGLETISMIEKRKYGIVTAWVDKNYDIYQKRNMKVDSPDKLAMIDYDYMVLAVLRADIREDKQRGVPLNKMIKFDINGNAEASLPKEFI